MADSNSTTGSLGRSPNGRDTGQNGIDFWFSLRLTPGAPNM
jgi:LAS superfamily LD-carboxypeptidase LdcB